MSAFWLFLAIWVACLVFIASEAVAKWSYSLLGKLFPGKKMSKLRALAAGWPELHRCMRGRRLGILIFSLVTWLVHLSQIWLFVFSLGEYVPFFAGVSLSALVLLTGLVPFTFAGIGVRDVAIVYVFGEYLSTEAALAVGILATSRSLLPAVAALPFIRRYGHLLLERRKANLNHD